MCGSWAEADIRINNLIPSNPRLGSASDSHRLHRFQRGPPDPPVPPLHRPPGLQRVPGRHLVRGLCDPGLRQVSPAIQGRKRIDGNGFPLVRFIVN